MSTVRTPSYRLHKPTNQAVVTLGGRDYYLGTHGTPESKAEYDRRVAEWLSNNRMTPTAPQDSTITELLAQYLRFAERHYVKNGEVTSEYDCLVMAMRPLKRLYGHTPVRDFGPLSLKAVREDMIRIGWCRNLINKNVDRIKRIFRWGVENERVPSSVFHGLQAVAGLRSGRSDARETEPVKPVADTHVDAIKPFVPPQIWAMIELQRITGARPGEICTIRTCDIDTSGELWEYRPADHKCIHRGQDRVIPLGQRAQAVLRPFLKSDLQAFIFTPEEAQLARSAERRMNRRSPMTPSQARRVRRRDDYRQCYTTLSYGRVIRRACERAFPPPTELHGDALKQWRHEHAWHPNQLRHSAGTRIRKELGLEAAQVWLGHKSADVTQIYAERNAGLAREIARKLG